MAKKENKAAPFVIERARKELKGESLGHQVWRHEQLARQQGLELVVELWAKRHPVSRAIGKLWKRSDELRSDTLHGIYLLRVNVIDLGPKAVVGLTPYAIFGVPLFLAWNKKAQLLAANALGNSDEAELVSVLSSFFADVAHQRAHTLHPAPRLPGASSPTASEKAPSDAQDRDVKRQPERPGALKSSPEVDVVTGGAAKVDAARYLEENLAPFLERALTVAQAFLEEQELRSDFSLHSLRAIDAFLDERAEQLDDEFIGKYLAPLGVYLGCVICAHGSANWFVDADEKSPIEALSLLVNGPGGEQTFRPVKLALERFSDDKKGFYGHAVAMCRTL